MVMIHRPLGYGPSTLPLRHSAQKNVSFRNGEKVLVHRDFVVTPEGRNTPCIKLRPQWYGPFEIF